MELAVVTSAQASDDVAEQGMLTVNALDESEVIVVLKLHQRQRVGSEALDVPDREVDGVLSRPLPFADVRAHEGGPDGGRRAAAFDDDRDEFEAPMDREEAEPILEAV